MRALRAPSERDQCDVEVAFPGAHALAFAITYASGRSTDQLLEEFAVRKGGVTDYTSSSLGWIQAVFPSRKIAIGKPAFL